MGHSGDRLAAAFDISRKEQDDYAQQSHTLAFEANKNRLLEDLLHVFVPGVRVWGSESVRVWNCEDCFGHHQLTVVVFHPHGYCLAVTMETISAGKGKMVSADNGIRVSTPEQMAKLGYEDDEST